MQDIYIKQTVNFVLQIRKLAEGESRLYDKECPKCGKPGLIFMWDIQLKKYKSNGRCANLSCKHGN